MIKKVYEKKRKIAEYSVSNKEEFIFQWVIKKYRRLCRTTGNAQFLCTFDQFMQRASGAKTYLKCVRDANYKAGANKEDNEEIKDVKRGCLISKTMANYKSNMLQNPTDVDRACVYIQKGIPMHCEHAQKTEQQKGKHNTDKYSAGVKKKGT